VVDDYHEVADSPVEQIVAVLHERSSVRLLVSSRTRPSWARARPVLYGHIDELTRDALAMTDGESAELLGAHAGSASVARQAEGWPAVLTLAAAAESAPPSNVLPSALHRYFAEELFQGASKDLREHLLRLSLLPPLRASAIEDFLGVEANTVIDPARDLGFASGEEVLELHPLVREFLAEKLTARADAHAQVYEAIQYSLKLGAHDKALELVSRFGVDEMIEAVLRQVFKPLVRSGRIGTLSAFADEVRRRPTFPPPSVDVVEAEVALRDGHLELANSLAARAKVHLMVDHPLRSRSSAIIGHSCLLRGFVREAEQAFSDARSTAADHRDETEALHGVALARITAERPDASEVVEELHSRRHESPALLVRAATAGIAHRRFSDGIAAPLAIGEARHALPQVEDPRVRSYFTYLVAYTLGQKAEYREAMAWLPLLMTDVEDYDLEFARPHALWTSALLRLGLRRFGEAERSLQALEDLVAAGQDPSHRVNARMLRARMLLQTGKADQAVTITRERTSEPTYPSWVAEYTATGALAAACLGDQRSADELSAEAHECSRVVEVQVLAEASRAVTQARNADPLAARRLFALAEALGAWDPVVCALRASRELASAASSDATIRRQLEMLYAKSNDLGLARQAGFRTRTNLRPHQVLTARELEVLGLIAQGMRNRDISAALFISQSTAKVHVKHVLEKLGVRTRAEAVARYERFATDAD
jgi:ATP/maltotriose-dependent transcriptional regulator MalT